MIDAIASCGTPPLPGQLWEHGNFDPVRRAVFRLGGAAHNPAPRRRDPALLAYLTHGWWLLRPMEAGGSMIVDLGVLTLVGALRTGWLAIAGAIYDRRLADKIAASQSA